MTENEIFDKLVDILKNQIQLSKEVSLKTALLGEQVLDSMDFINYITSTEEVFHVKISDDDISNLKLGIMENMVRYLKDK